MGDPLPLSTLFLARSGRSAPAGSAEELEATLQRQLAAARAEWPGVALSDRAFVEHLADRAASPSGKAATLADLHAADLFIACAAASGVPGAIAALEQRCFPALDRAVASLDRSPAFADEVRQELRDRLFLSKAGAPPKLATYSGDGPLAAWLRVAALRAAGRLRQGREKDVELDEAVLRDRPGDEANPEVQYLKQTYRREFRDAFQKALAALDARQRNLLRMHTVDELTGDQIAAVYRVNPGTISRWLAKARGALMEETRRHLREQLGLSDSQLDSLSGLVVSQLDLSLPRLLK